MKKILFLTGSRAEWGLLKPLATEFWIKQFSVHVAVFGGHTSPHHGTTINDIYSAKWKVHRIETLLSNDSPTAIIKTAGLTMISIGELYENLHPDAVVVLGDRFDILAGVMAAYIARIPIIHLHGGETTKGSYDDGFRNAITQMSTLHFPANQNYAFKIARMIDDEPDVSKGLKDLNVFNVGAIGCDGLKKREYTEGEYYMFAYYPETTTYHAKDLMTVVEAITAQGNPIYWIESNPDVHANIVNSCQMEYFEQYTRNRDVEIIYEKFKRDEYIKKLKGAIAIVGNSSSGIIEAPALGVPTINIGTRQSGRLKAGSIIDSTANEKSLKSAFDLLHADRFQEAMKGDYTIQYKGGKVAQKIVRETKRFFKWG